MSVDAWVRISRMWTSSETCLLDRGFEKPDMWGEFVKWVGEKPPRRRSAGAAFRLAAPLAGADGSVTHDDGVQGWKMRGLDTAGR